ncbi:hypothetical protein Pmar_PMAR007951 [Perkinsus marinus ATCC 50983]|uniref:Uncharacterized protein n=1 Tax=Perkinsus marinus (strain ATCC 50983 / TXsc) TaxID=423536 RepID=C5L4T9_PERM5|nr:hypothetical protein Pmar_PMAR007951 [Perkinsus marinus ATCC 50983]EER08280.1 hypothetical protein Pmar_PMAR007951 [Perkinsus marinus ATCC 50983]|eukprot:XP_002776464.1 hypothetical protein Pmar_PMAR007951 [Perkinsus marinus ATCC 50983]
MLDFLNSFWRWMFRGADLDHFLHNSEYRDGWWYNLVQTYAGWAMGIGHASFLTMILIFLFILAGIMLFDNMLPQFWEMFKKLVRDNFGIVGKVLLAAE